MRNIAKLPGELPRSSSAVQMGNIAKLPGELPQSSSAVQMGNIAELPGELPRSFSATQMGNIAKLPGKLSRSFSAVQMGRLHYTALEIQKVKALKFSKDNYKKLMIIDEHVKEGILWWRDNVLHTCLQQFNRVLQ